jgi:hypothetical protein
VPSFSSCLFEASSGATRRGGMSGIGEPSDRVVIRIYGCWKWVDRGWMGAGT